jgi:hypothetical protein
VLTFWFDPGLLSGVCVVDSDTGELLYLDEHDLQRTADILEPGMQLFGGQPPLIGTMSYFKSRVQVGWETYRIMKGPQTQAPWSLETIGAIKYMCLRNGYKILEPAAPSERLVCTPKMLKDIGWYPKVVGKKDALSAAQHTVAWWLRTDTLPEQYREQIYGPLR